MLFRRRNEYDNNDRHRSTGYGMHSRRPNRDFEARHTVGDWYGLDNGSSGDSHNINEGLEVRLGAWEKHADEYVGEYRSSHARPGRDHLNQHEEERRHAHADSYHEVRVPAGFGPRSYDVPTPPLTGSGRPITFGFDGHKELRSSDLRRDSEALGLLHMVASLVAPIMRNHDWYVPLLEEFSPEDPTLEGRHKGTGAGDCVKIQVRLRSPNDPVRSFQALEHVVDTVLHELAHFEHKLHNDAFLKMWNELRDEYEAYYPQAKRLPRVGD